MGVRGLLSFCSPIHVTRPITSIPPCAIGVDAYSVFYMFKDRLDRVTELLEQFCTAGHTLTFILDKRAAAQKQETVKRREEVRATAARRVNLLEEFRSTPEYEELTPQQKKSIEDMIRSKQYESWHMTPGLLSKYRELLTSKGITMETAEEEADTALANGVKEGRWGAVVSNDSDLLLLQVPTLLLLNHKSIATVQTIDIHEFYRFTGLSAETTPALAILAGSDVSPRPILPIAHAVSWLRYYGSLDVIHRRFPEIVTEEILERAKEILSVYK